jgi:tetratricopeptide (TPR) repeat protein
LRFRLLALILLGGYLLSGCQVKQQVKGYYYLDSKKYKQGISYFKEEVRKKPEDSSINYFLGRLYLAEKKPEEGLRYLKRSAKLNPQKADYQFWLGVAYSANKKPDLERKSYLKALSLNRNHVQALVYFGHSQLERKEYKDALSKYFRALEIEPTNPQALYNRAIILRHLKRTPEEIKAWKAYLANYHSGAFATRAVRYLNKNGNFEYRNYLIGKKFVALKEVKFEPFTATISSNSKSSLDVVGLSLANNTKQILHIITYQKNNAELAKSRAQDIKNYLLKKQSNILSSLIKLSWFGVPEKLNFEGKTYMLNSSVRLFTEPAKEI